MALTTGGIAGLEWGFDSPTWNPITRDYNPSRGLVYNGTDPVGVGQNTDLGKFLNWYAYNQELMRYASVDAGLYNTQTPLSVIQKTVSAEGAAIPIVYGNAQVGGQIFAMGYNTTTKKWTVGYILCLGEIEAVDTVLINGAAAVAGVLVDKYTGINTQTYNTRLGAAIAGYTDPMIITIPGGPNIGIAYIVIQYTDKHYEDWPKVTATIRGRKVYKASTATTVYSDNPALHLADFLSNTKYGLGYSVDTASLLLAEQYCDETVVSEVRRKGYCVIDSPQDASNWAEILRGYAGCFVRIRGDTAFFTPDKIATSVMSIGTDKMVEDSIVIRKKDSSDIPTVVRASYTDTTGTEWRERLCLPAKAAGVDAGTTEWREQRIRLTGCTRHSQAHRECIERLNKATLTDLEIEWTMFDDGMQLEIGDVVEVTHTGYGLTAKTLRVVDHPEQVSPGRWRIRTQEYRSDAYATTVVTDTAASDTGLPATITPKAPTGLVLTDTLTQMATGEWTSRLGIAWTAPADSVVTGYNVEVKARPTATLVWSTNTTATSTSTSVLEEGVTYDVYVKAYNALYIGPAVTEFEMIDGKSDIPLPPSGLQGSNTNGDVRLWWTASPDADVKTYEIRYYTTAQTWANGTLLDRTSSLTFTTRIPAPGSTWRFGVKSLDTTGHYSATAIERDIPVSLSTSGVTTFISDNPPSANAAGDLWFESDQLNRLYYATAPGVNWTLAQDGSSKIKTFYQDSTPMPVSTAVGDLWMDLGDSNRMYRAGSIGANEIKTGEWELVQDKTIPLTTSSVNQPATAKSGDVWLKPIQGSAGLSGYNSWVSTLAPNYAQRFNGSVTSAGTVTDWPAYAGTYGSIALTNDPTAQGINQATGDVFAGLQLDTDGGDHAVLMSIYLPPSPSDGAWGLYSNGGTAATSNGQGIYVVASGGVYTLVAGITSATADEVDKVRSTISSGVHTVGAEWDTVTNDVALFVDGARVGNAVCTGTIANSAVNPRVGDHVLNMQATGENPIAIDGSGIVIGHFLEEQTTSGGWYDNGVYSDFHNHLMVGTQTGTEFRVYNGTSWDLITDPGITDAMLAASDAQATADGKVYTWIQATAPTGLTATDVGDLWIDSNSSPANQMFRWDGDSWELIRDAGIATAQATADGKIASFYQTSAPSTGVKVGDIWIDTTSGKNILKYCTSISPSVVWTSVQDSATALATANLKNTVYYQDDPPSGADEGDLWYDTNDGNQLYIYYSAAWTTLDPTKLLRQRDVFGTGNNKTSSFAAVAGNRYTVDATSATTIIITMPTAPVIGDAIGIVDIKGKFGIHPPEIEPGTLKIMGGTAGENMVCGVRWSSFTLEYTGTTNGWMIT